jgi:hypothetical protein
MKALDCIAITVHLLWRASLTVDPVGATDMLKS